MYSFEECHFCNSTLENNRCSTELCDRDFEYQIYPDLNMIDFYLGNYIFEIYFFENKTPKRMMIINNEEAKAILDIDYHIEVDQDSYLNLIKRISNLDTFK